MTARWAAILDGAEAATAQAVIAEIADAARHSEIGDPALASGTSSEALLFAYLHRASGRERDRERAEHALQRAFEATANRPLPAALHTGFVGVAWTAEHMRVLGCIDDEDVNADVDAALLAHVEQLTTRDHWDLRSGLIGIGAYCRERTTLVARACLDAVVERLLVRRRGAAWLLGPELLPDHLRERHPRGAFSLGMAHGTASVVAFLSRVGAGADVRDDAIAWVLAQQLADRTYPAMVSVDGRPGSPAPFCWCNGEPGLAAGLGMASEHPRVLQLALDAAARVPDHADVPDASVCCGAGGCALAFARLWQHTGRSEFHAAARAWFARTLALARRRGPYRSGILRGHPGIALALLAAITEVEPTWDRVLLLS